MMDWRDLNRHKEYWSCSLSSHSRLLLWDGLVSDGQIHLHCILFGFSPKGQNLFGIHQNSSPGNWDLLAPKEHLEVEETCFDQNITTPTTSSRNEIDPGVNFDPPWREDLTSIFCNLRGIDPVPVGDSLSLTLSQVFCRNLESLSRFLEFESGPCQRFGWVRTNCQIFLKFLFGQHLITWSDCPRRDHTLWRRHCRCGE